MAKAKKKKPGPGKKGAATRQRIIDAAAICLAKFGEAKTSFQNIADECGVSQALVIHYFKKRENIFFTVLQERMRDTQERSTAVIDAQPKAFDKLVAYLELSFEIFRERAENEKLYLGLFYLGGFETRYRKLNTELRRVAVERITKIVRQGMAEDFWYVKSPTLAAKVIHNALVGNLLAQTTEQSPVKDDELIAGLIAFCHGYFKLA